jgi:hypothetical protein
VSGKSWEVLEDRCQPTTPIPPPTTAAAAAYEAEAEEVEAATELTALVTNALTGPTQASFATLHIIIVLVFATAMCVTIAVAMIAIRKVRKPDLDHLWWEDEVTRKDMMSQ